MNDLKTDTFFNGRIKVSQSLTGYRFSIDAVILANTTLLKPGDRICDVGTGCGIIPLVLAYRYPEASRIYGIDIQEPLAKIAALNAKQNEMDQRIQIITADITTVTSKDTEGPVDLITCNPPHHARTAGRINPNSEKAIARHEITLSINKLLSAARRMLVPNGRLIMIYPASRITDLLSSMRAGNIEPKNLRFVYTAPGREASRVIVEGVLGAGAGAKIAVPLLVTDETGDYTPEVKAMFSG